jgi:hypothetical protein
MKWLWRSSVLVIAVAAIVIASCSDDEGPAGPGGDGTVDKTAPEIDTVMAVDGNHVEVYFNEAVLRGSAERTEFYQIVEGAPGGGGGSSPAPGDTLVVNSVSLKSDEQTAVIQVVDRMANLPYHIYVCCVEDVAGNKIPTTESKTFTGTTAQDNTPPEIVYRSPVPGATGVGTAQPVVVQFSEIVRGYTVLDGFSWTGGSGVLFDIETQDEIRFVITPKAPLSNNTTYTVTFSNVSDYDNNIMPTASWSFTTTRTPDTVAPTLVSTSPFNGQKNVDVNTNLVLTFSEAVDQTNFEALMTPSPGDGVEQWSNGGRTVTFDPNDPLLDDTQYYLLMSPGDVRDLAGNWIEEPVTILFTTGSSFESGSFAGTISGDPNTPAANPAGAIVIAPNVLPFDVQGGFDVLGSDVVGSGGTYRVPFLPDGVYYPVAVMDSNDDGKIDPDEGDAIGAYGIDFRQLDMIPDSVTIAGGSSVNNVDFPLFDQMVIVGTFSYNGSASGDYLVKIAVFDVNGFDINNLPPPVFGTEEWWPYNNVFRMSETETEDFAAGSYYIGAFMDINGNGDYDPDSEPANFYGGIPTPTAVTIANGQDALGIHITLVDPAGATAAAPVPWPSSGKKDAEWFERLSAIVRQAAK